MSYRVFMTNLWRFIYVVGLLYFCYKSALNRFSVNATTAQAKKKKKNDCYISWTYLSELLMLHIKLSLLDVGVHAPKRSRDTLHLERRNLTSS